MASNAPGASDPRFIPRFGGGNMLNPNGQFAGTQPTAPQDPFAGYATTAPNAYPSWLTDPTARGLGTDWAPTAHQDVADQVFTPRVIPPDAPPAPAPFVAQATAAPAAAAPAPVADLSGEPGATSQGGGGGEGDSGGDGAGFFKGGIVTKNRLLGPNPHGPDDGFGPLNKGEGILTAAAVKYYGRGIVGMLNKLVVPKEALAGQFDDEDDEARADDEDDEKPAAKKARDTDEKKVRR